MTTLSQQINKSTVVDPPHGFILIENAVPEATWEILQTWIDSNWLDAEHIAIPWQTGAQNRTVAQFGFHYDYINDRVDKTTPTAPIPLKLKELLDIDKSFTQCIINRYESDVLIPWHKDDLEFGPTISVCTFGEARPLMLRFHDNNEAIYVATPGHCSKYILSKSARYEWEHMVPTGSGFRVSFTFRTHKDD